MNDKITSIDELKNLVKKFTQDRDWQQFHSPKTIASYLSLECAELLEIFVWADNKESKDILEKKRLSVEHEVADIAYWVLQMCWQHNIDLSGALKNKLEHNAQKYPIEKFKGSTKKYNEI